MDRQINHQYPPRKMNRMNILFTVIVEAVKKHGLPFLVMLGLVAFSHNQNEKLKTKIRHLELLK
jgi:hypothetical protein